MNLRSAVQQVYLSTKPKPWRLEKPSVIQFPVNDICNCKCQMCNIWQQKFDYQITPSELEQALSNPLFSEVSSVGINGGEPTLRKDLPDLVDVLFQKLPKLSAIALITNSLNSSQVIERISEIGQVIKNYHRKLDVIVSLDGVGEVHDRVRGRKGNFENAVKVIDFITESELVTSYRLGCTVIKENIYGLHDLLEFALSKNIYIKYRLGIPHQRLYSNHVVEPFDLSFAEKYHFAIFLENLIKFYEKSDQQKFFYKSLIGQLIYKKARTAGCSFQHRGATLSARGELLYCAVESKTLGSAVLEDAEKLYFENKQHLAEIIKTKCDTCAHDYVGLPPTKVLLKGYVKKVLSRLGISSDNFRNVKPLHLLLQKQNFTKRMNLYGLNSKKLGHSQPALQYLNASSQKRKVLICGWYGTETLGDKAILGGVINALHDSLPNMEIHLASLEPYISEMTIQQMSELQGCELHSITSAVQVAGAMDLVVFGGGPLMALSVLADMIAIFQKALEGKVPTLIAGCGVGPLGAPFYNQVIKYLLEKASHRIYRDQKSKQIAQMLGVDTALDEVAEDPAFTWVQSCMLSDTNSQIQSEIAKPMTLLLGLRDWPYQEYAYDLSLVKAERLKNSFEKEIIKALEQLVNKYPNLKIVPFPMCTNHIGNDDRWFYRKLFRNNSQIQNSLDLTHLAAEISPLDAVNIFKSASVALTMRFHSIVFALSTGIPTVAIDYTLGKGKVNSLAEKYQTPCMSLSSINSEFIVDSVSNFLDQDNASYDYEKGDLPLNFTNSVSKFIKSLEQ